MKELKDYSIEEKRELIDKINMMQKMERLFITKNGRKPKIEELAEKMESSVEEIDEINNFLKLLKKEDEEFMQKEFEDEEIGIYGSYNEIKMQKVPEEFEKLKKEIKENFDILQEREKQVISLRFGLTDGKYWTLEELQNEFNITEIRVKQIIAKSIRKVKHPEKVKKINKISNLLDNNEN